MTSFACLVGEASLIFMWISLSVLVPLIGGALGDLIYRASTGKDEKAEPYTYAISAIPFFGPIISAFILTKVKTHF